MTNHARPSPTAGARAPSSAGGASITPSAVTGSEATAAPSPADGIASASSRPASGGVSTPTGDAGPEGAPSRGWGGAAGGVSSGSSRNSFWMRDAVSGFPF